MISLWSVIVYVESIASFFFFFLFINRSGYIELGLDRQVSYNTNVLWLSTADVIYTWKPFIST